MVNINELMAEVAQYARMAEEIGATLDSLKDELKSYMLENNLETLQGTEHRATYKPVTSSRIDTTALKKNAPEIAAQYTKTTQSMRFTFA